MSEAPATTPPPSKAKIFFRRLLSTVILWTVIVAALFSRSHLISDGVFLLLMVLLAFAGLAEFYGMVEKRGLVCFKWCGHDRRRAADGRDFFERDRHTSARNDSPGARERF